MIDYEAIIDAINGEIRRKLPYIGKEQGNTGVQPDYPFFTYSITSPYLNPKTFRRGETLIEEVEVVISYTWLAEDSFLANSLTQKTISFLKAEGTRQRLSDKGIVVVKFDGIGSRDNFISIQVERRAGFDLRIRITHSDTESMEIIETVEL